MDSMTSEDVGRMLALKADSSVNAGRLIDELTALAKFGLREDGGVAREALTATELDARHYLIGRALKLGCEVTTDGCANLFFRRPGKIDCAPVMTGSHIDTQPVGGKLDGAYGVVAALEVIEALNDAGIKTERPIEVVIWTNEEGSRFSPGTMGSSAFADSSLLPSFRKTLDSDGISFGDAVDRTLLSTPNIAQRDSTVLASCFIELHIEQGPVLEKAGVSLGYVTAIQGVRWFSVTFTGQAAHAGTTPMALRTDAMRAAVRCAEEIYALADDYAERGLRVTLGRWRVHPNSINTIPGKVDFSIDLRCINDTTLNDFEHEIRIIVGRSDWPGKSDCNVVFNRETTHFPAPMVSAAMHSCVAVTETRRQKSPIAITSGAFHDAMYLADVCPTAMIFVPSVKGISHNPAEDTDPRDLYLGACALANLIVSLSTFPLDVD